MRILHVGDDYAALRPCGLTLYSDALMRAQVAAGHQVAYVFSGRHYPRLAGPRLKRWRHRRIRMYELIGSPNHRHWDLGTRTPGLDVEEPAGRRAFEVALDDTRPDVVHIHELARLPSSVIEGAKGAGVPVMMTLHDYKPLCSTVRLLHSDGGLCTRRDIGEDCARNCATAPVGAMHLTNLTVEYEVQRLKGAVPFAESFDYSALAPAMRLIRGGRRPRGEASNTASVGSPREPAAPPDEYQSRRDINVARLNICDVLVAPSGRVAEIYAALGVDSDRLVVQRLSLPHLEQLHPRRGPSVSRPLTFVTLGGLASRSKGSHSLLAAVRDLEAAGLGGKYRLLAYGVVDGALEAELASTPSVTLAGTYRPEQLDSLLEHGDIGVLPSVWEEAHGFVGIEMLAKGLPLIASALGGIPEYVRDGETGWLDESASGAGLARLMAAAIDDPADVERLRTTIRERRADHVRPFAEHVAEVEALYGEVTAAES